MKQFVRVLLREGIVATIPVSRIVVILGTMIRIDNGDTLYISPDSAASLAACMHEDTDYCATTEGME